MPGNAFLTFADTFTLADVLATIDGSIDGPAISSALMATRDLDSFARPGDHLRPHRPARQLGLRRRAAVLPSRRATGRYKATTADFVSGVIGSNRSRAGTEVPTMSTHLLFLIVGLGAGAAYAAVAMALVTTYRGTGVVNIAQGAMAMWAAFVYDELRKTGTLVLPVGRLHVGRTGGPVAGDGSRGRVGRRSWRSALHLLVFRPLRSAPVLGRVVASVGVTVDAGRRWWCCGSAPAAARCRRCCPTSRFTSGRSRSPRTGSGSRDRRGHRVGAMGVRSLHPTRAGHPGGGAERAGGAAARLLA